MNSNYTLRFPVRHLFLAQVEECKEKFLKECTIEYEPRSEPREVEVCDERLTRDCDDRSGREVCSTEYQTGTLSVVLVANWRTP